MRQAVIPRYGAPDVFEMREAPDPVPGDGDVRIRVRAAGISFADRLTRIGLYPDAPKPPVVGGYERARVLDAGGEADVKRLTKGRGVDVILDPIGGGSFAASYRMLAPLGRLVMLGISSMSSERREPWRVLRSWWAMKSFAPLSLMNRNRGVFGLNVGHLWDERRPLQALMDLMMTELGAGRLEPVVARTFPLERVADAHRFMQARSNMGKVVFTS